MSGAKAKSPASKGGPGAIYFLIGTKKYSYPQVLNILQRDIPECLDLSDTYIPKPIMAESPGVAPGCTDLESARSLRSTLHIVICQQSADRTYEPPESISVKPTDCRQINTVIAFMPD
ncbi:hypothetical protein [Desulfosporosinus lacus]|uniref:Uncharacterized protein n=1 Tax=Desulfosporosinus lacus DSM 15449 TaxID=1121420 RepID=A0A1M6GN99_9FIRM|nr:hypothetical protein [Desulfosporosinus lacus]SHJ11409.1 hypothetical protein SAMN02746098_05186 [Desulfosporosinus lacus DSM 15449]